MPIVFNGTTRQIEVTDSSIFELEAGKELYSEWKRWQQLDPANAGFAPAFRTFGGDPTATGQAAPKYYFLINYWTVLIDNGNIVSVALNLYSDDFVTPYIVNPGSGVSDRNSDAVSVNSEAIEFASYNGVVTVDVGSGFTGTAFPTGTPQQPVNNLDDALLIATERGFSRISFVSDFTFVSGDNISLFTIEGEGSSSTLLTFDPGCITAGTRFETATIQGTLISPQAFHNVTFLDMIGNTIGVIGTMEVRNCVFDGTITLSSALLGEIDIIDCISGIAGATSPIFDANGANVDILVRNYTGGMLVKNITHPDVEMSFDFNSGSLTLDSTCTDGLIVARGVGKLINNSNGTTVLEEFLDTRNLNKPLFTNGQVFIDSTSLESGTIFPLGTNGRPVNSLTDGLAIAQTNGLKGISLTGFFSATGSHNLDGISVTAGSGSSNVLILAGASTASSSFSKLIVTGAFNGLSRIRDCILGTTGLGGVTEIEGRVVDCIINNSAGIVQKAAGAGTLFDNCSFLAPDDPQIVLDANGKGFSLRECTGNILVTNKTDIEADQIHLTGARIELGASCTAGTITLDGSGTLTDNSAGTTVVDNLSSSGISPALELKIDDIHGQVGRSVYIDTEKGINGNGYQETPYNNFTDAVDYAENNNLYDLIVHADATVDRQLKNFQITGLGNPVIDLNGQIMDKTTLSRVTITGSYSGDILANECAVVNVSALAGVFLTCSFAGTLTVAPGSELLISRVAPALAAQPWTLNMNSGVPSTCAIHNISGGVIINNMDHPDDVLHILSSQGEVVIGSSCIAGNIVIAGVVLVTDNSGVGCTVTLDSTVTELTSADISADLTIINEGVQKASIFIPHTTDL